MEKKPNPLVDLFRSKKALVTMKGLVLSIGVYVGLDLPEEQAEQVSELILYFVGAYVIGQGLADFGKEKK